MSNWQNMSRAMALIHNQNSEHTSTPRQVVVASPHLYGTPYDRKVALIVEGERGGFRGIVVNEAFRRSLQLARQSIPVKPLSRLDAPKPIELGVIDWAPGKLQQEIQSGVWMPTATTFETVLAKQDELWANLVRGIGRKVLRDSLGISQFPDDVRVN